jgi:hypothetical protein
MVRIAARNVRKGDWLKNHVGNLQLVSKVERVDFEDRIMVRIVTLDTSTWVDSCREMTFRLDHMVQVEKGPAPREMMSWAPCYSDTTNRKKRLYTPKGSC